MKAVASVRTHLDAESSPPAGEISAVQSSTRGATTRLLVVAPDAAWCGRLAGLLPSGEVLAMTCTETEAREAAGRFCPDVVLVLLYRPDGDGPLLLEALRELVPRAGLVVLDSWPTMASALEALRQGAYAYLPWPQSAATLTSRVRGAHNLERLLAGSDRRSDDTRDEPPRSPEPLPALAA